MIDYTALIAAVDAQLLALQTQMQAGTMPTGIQSMSVAGRSISYRSIAEGIEELLKFRQQLEVYQNRLSNGFFSRGRVMGGGRTV